MKTKRITAWILFVAMLMTMLPSTIALAVPTNGSPELAVTLYTQDSSMTDGDDLVYGVESTYDIGAGGKFNEVAQEIDSTTWQNADIASKELLPASKRMAVSIKAKSQDSTFGTGHKLWDEEAVQYTYLDLDKNPLHEEDDGTMINITTGDVEWHNYADLMTYPGTIEDFNKDETVRLSKVAAVNQQLVDDKGVEVVIWNIIKKEFTGYLRVKVTDQALKSTIQDVLVIADGNYPEIEVSSVTEKNLIGEVNLAEYDVQIDGRKFRSAKTLASTEINSDWKTNEDVISDDDMKAEIAKMKDGKDGYVAHDFWAMNDIKLSITATDSEMSSELKSVKWNVYNYPNTINLIPTGTDTPIVEGSIVLPTYRDGGVINVEDASTNDLYKKTIIASDYLPGNANGYTPQINEEDLIIPETAEGFNVLVVTVEDVAGLTATNYYYYFMDNTNPDAEYELVKLDEQVAQLFSDADTVTKWNQGIDMSASEDVVGIAQLISEIDTEDSDVYQYRLLAKDSAALAIPEEEVPAGYTKTAPADTNLTYGEWLDWSLDPTVAVIDEEFDGLIQVRVQDRAGNWSVVTADDDESVLADNTDAVLEFEAYELEEFNTLSIFAPSILKTGANAIENRQTKWIKDSAVLFAQVSDEDLANKIRSSGLFDGSIKIEAKFDAGNENKAVKLCAFDEYGNRVEADDLEITDEATLNSSNIEKYCFTGGGSELDKHLGFVMQYDGTGVADITFTITDKAENVLDYSADFVYNVELRVDKINPVVNLKGYDITDADAKDLLKPNSGSAVDYELRNMPWGPNSQVLEVNVVDNDVTAIQSGFLDDDGNNTGKIAIKSDKTLYIYADADAAAASDKADAIYVVDADLTKETVIDVSKITENIANLDYTFYAVYEGTGIAKVEVYAKDEAENVRDYPSSQATPVEYDAMLRVDKINPEIKNAQLVQTDADVNDSVSLFTVNETNVDVNTRKQMKVVFEISDENTTTEQSGVNIQNEEIAGVALIDVYDKYVETDKTHLYDNEATAYATDDVNDDAIDPNIDYILIPAEVGAVNSTEGGFFKVAFPTEYTNDVVSAWVDDSIAKWAEDGIDVEWQNAIWEDGSIVIPNEFQGAIVLRTIDRVGNIDYAKPITFVAESKEAAIEFNPQNGYIWSQNNYGWSKRNYDYVEIRVKDNNETAVADAWLENVFISVTDLDGNDISTKDTVKFAHKIHADNPEDEVDPSAYNYVSLAEFTNEAAYGYDVIDADGLVETLARDDEGYIHLGFVRVTESAEIKVTIFDKAKHNDVEYTGNKTTGKWISRIDRTAPVVEAFEFEKLDSDTFALILMASDNESGLAPQITDKAYNVYTPENNPATRFASEKSFLYNVADDSDNEVVRFNSGTFNLGQYELPGLQYALLEEGDTLEDIEPWEFEKNPNGLIDGTDAFSAEGYYRGEQGKVGVWHNYNDAMTAVIDGDFDGYIVVRAIDKAGNITVVGYAPTLDVTADDDWKNETQFINVKALDVSGDAVTSVEYYGNNGLLYPETEKRDITAEALSGEGAFIEVVEEGITKVVVRADKTYADERVVAVTTEGRNDIWEGTMTLGTVTPTGEYEDWKYHVASVKIDKTNPEYDFALIDQAGNVIADNAVDGTVTIKISNLVDPLPNQDEPSMSHIASDIAKVEWCAVPEGSSEEKWADMTASGDDYVAQFDADAFTGTIKVKVTDNAGNVVEKSQRLNVDGVAGIINLSKSHDDIYALEPVDVFVTVTENAEFSDIEKVVYEVTDEAGNIVEEDVLTLIGGTVSVDREGTSKVKVTATTKAGVEEVKEILVKIDMTAPTFDLEVKDSAGSVEGRTTNENVTIKALNAADAVSGVAKVEYAVIPEGTADENYKELATAGAEFAVTDAFTGTVKVCVTDVAGHVTVKTMEINIDKKAPLVVVSKSNEHDYSKENVNVFVTVTENAEYSDVVSVTYTVNGGAEEILALNGGTISVVEEGETEIVVTAKTKAGVRATATTFVLIDKTAPTFDLEVKDSAGSVEGRTTNENVTIKALNAADAVSGVAKVEYAVIPEGTADENYKELATAGAEFAVTDAFTGTVKVRVTDNAGHETVKTQRINIDKVVPLITITNDSTGKCSHEPVTVFVTVTENAEFSDVKKVTYVLENGTTITNGDLTLNGGTILVNNEGTTKVTVTAENKAGEKATAETTVVVHYADLEMPTLDGVNSGEWVDKDAKLKVNYSGEGKVWYSLNGSIWDEVEANEISGLIAGANTIRLQAKNPNCLCESDVNTYVLNCDAGMPELTHDRVEKAFNGAISITSKDAVVIGLNTNSANSTSEIRSLTYKLWYPGIEGAKRYLAPNGGSIVLSNEGEYTVKDITVEMESGKTYVLMSNESLKNVKDIIAGEETLEFDVVIDKKAPVIDPDVTKVQDVADDSVALFEVRQKMQDLIVKVTDDHELLKVEYAAVEKGTEPVWTEIVGFASGDTKTVEDIIDKAFDGTVLVRATDSVGNVSTWSQTVFTEGIKPEISMTYPNNINWGSGTEDKEVWLSESATITVNVIDKGLSSQIKEIRYEVEDCKDASNNRVGCSNDEDNNWAKFNSNGGQIIISEEGSYKVKVTATDYAGNYSEQFVWVNIDKTAPTYSGSVSLSTFNIHTINNWDDIHDGWTYNHPVSIAGIVDELSGLKDIKVRVTTESGVTDETVLNASQTDASFSTDGEYVLTITDNAGNARTIGFVIDKDLKNVINVVGVDEFGKVHVAVTDGDEMLSFYSIEDESNAKVVDMHNGITDQIWDGRTGVRYIYGVNGKKQMTNKLHLIVAPSDEYEITLASIMDTVAVAKPNRFLSFNESGNVTVKKIVEEPTPNADIVFGLGEEVKVNSNFEINEDGIYTITTKN